MATRLAASAVHLEGFRWERHTFSVLSALPTICALIGMCLLGTAGCAVQGGRIAIILDNSGSMAQTGTPFEDIKSTLLDTLSMLPISYEIGLRVFENNKSRLVADYANSLDGLRAVLPQIHPAGGTFIGKSLLDVVGDLLRKPQGVKQLILITDGEGTSRDIQDAEEAKTRLEQLHEKFTCHFIIFSARSNINTETPIGNIANILGCNIVIPGPRPTASTLAAALNYIVSKTFYPLWIIVSLLAYITLLVLTTYLFFAAQYANSILPRHARWKAIMFFAILLPVVVGTHMIGPLGWSSTFMWLLVLLAWMLLVVGFPGVSATFMRPSPRNQNDDPFAYPRKRR